MEAVIFLRLHTQYCSASLCRHREEIQLLLSALPLPRDAGDPNQPLDLEGRAASQQLPAIVAVFLAEAAIAVTNTSSAYHKIILRLLKRGTLSVEVSSMTKLI